MLTKKELLAQLEAVRAENQALRQERDDLELLLETMTRHSDTITDELQIEKDDLELLLEVATEHADVLSEELENRAELIYETFGRYVNEDVVASLLDSPDSLVLGGEKFKVSILFSDLRGFTALSERLDPQEVVTFLNRYLEAMVNIILDYYGTIIEILGDGIMVIFGAPIKREDDAERAVACAIDMQLAMHGVNEFHQEMELPEVEMGIGIHTGEVVVGNIGSQRRTKYGAVGSDVNLTGRIESYTIGGQLLISEVTYQDIQTALTIGQEITVEPKGVKQPITIYEVLGIGAPYNCYLSRDVESLIALDSAIPIRFTVLEEKFAGRAIIAGSLVKLSRREAEILTDTPVNTLTNLKIHVLQADGEAVEGDLFAKVLESPDDESQASVVPSLIRFMSIPPAIQTLFDGLLTP